MAIEFKEFPKIPQIGKLYMTITQKLHGSNAQIYVFENESGQLDLMAGSRSRWLVPTDDNFGFAKFCTDRKQEIIEKLGLGRHFGEWVGAGINTGEGLKEKALYLFNWRRWVDKELPRGILTVPILYHGKISLEAIEETMLSLKESGSRIVAGYMKPEGVVIELDGSFYKKTFDNEEIAWKCKEKTERVYAEAPDVSHLLQPIRLEKILSRDEVYLREYPKSLSTICGLYVDDLQSENQITGNEEEVRLVKKSLGKYVYPFIKSVVEDLNNEKS